MPNRTPLSPTEKAIGQRLREIREELLVPKTSMAIEIGISREKLYNYESGRTPLPWRIGSALCNRFDVNPLWLAEGVGPKTLMYGFPAAATGLRSQEEVGNRLWSGFGDELQFGERTLFSDAVRLMPDDLRRYCQGGVAGPGFANDMGKGMAKQFLTKQISVWLKAIDPRNEDVFARELKVAGDLIASTLKLKRS